eukprot:66452-Prymnesium_polylepis.1
MRLRSWGNGQCPFHCAPAAALSPYISTQFQRLNLRAGTSRASNAKSLTSTILYGLRDPRSAATDNKLNLSPDSASSGHPTFAPLARASPPKREGHLATRGTTEHGATVARSRRDHTAHCSQRAPRDCRVEQ